MVVPSMVTCRSCIASRRADWVFGEARFISSARMMFPKTGPCIILKSESFWSKT